ncbi:hypothetical protein [Actinomadura fibrosa]|uniref:DUF3592 domain-containing protein n=1 Tax=Actinomadura fibrosa TaxID=111802 RepID=A0ABW2XBJ7_9ACTN|nr:hypothetical protein [Actinomadura fibrosa]
MVGLFLLSWVLYLRLNLDAMVDTVRLATAPEYTATVEPPRPGGDLPVLHWTGAEGVERYGRPDASDGYRPGEKVRVVEYSAATCWTWESDEDQLDDVSGMILFLFVLPAAAITRYLVHRRRHWLAVLRAARAGLTAGQVVALYEFGRRKVVTVDLGTRRVYVPLLNGQFVNALTSLDGLQVQRLPDKRFIAFRVAGTDRVVWPSGRYRRRMVPVADVVARLAWVGGPPLLTLAVHLFTAPLSPC